MEMLLLVSIIHQSCFFLVIVFFIIWRNIRFFKGNFVFTQSYKTDGLKFIKFIINDTINTLFNPLFIVVRIL